jgi:hypothetical protein
MGVSLVKQRNLGERIKANAGRGIVVFDDYTKYNTPALDRCILSVYDEGKLNTPQGEIDCPAMLFFFSSSETEEEFLICPEQEIEKVMPSRRLLRNSEETIPERTIVRRVGHPEGFARKTRFVSLTRLKGEVLRDILSDHFSTTILPTIWRNAKVELSQDMLTELVRLNEARDDNAQQAFDMTSIQTALLEFRREFNFTPQESPDLIIDYEDRSVKIHFRNPEDAYQRSLEDRREELALHPVQQIGCFRSFCRRYGISSFLRSLYERLEEDYYPEYDRSVLQNPGHHSRERRRTHTSTLNDVTAQDRQLPKPANIPSMREPNISPSRYFRSKSYSCSPKSTPMEDIEEMHVSSLEGAKRRLNRFYLFFEIRNFICIFPSKVFFSSSKMPICSRRSIYWFSKLQIICYSFWCKRKYFLNNRF